jgi:hypothetical protein
MVKFTSRRGRTMLSVGMLSVLALGLAGCETLGTSQPPPVEEPAVAPEIPPTIRPSELVGRWGLASYQNPDDRARTIAAAKAQCKNPLDRVILSFDGRILVTRFVDKDAGTRYGNMVYVRCGPHA